MSGYTDSEKVQYALKTALSRTMQTAMSDSAGAEKSAPLRIFPSNIMKVDIIEKGKGDIDDDGNYVTGHKDAGTAANMSTPEDTVKNYKIICPVNNVVTSITISSLVSYGSSTLSFINGRSTSGTNYPLKQWFYRGHLSGTGEAAFGTANTNYHGLQLAWNSATNGATPTEANIVPHLKYYLQVQTVYTGEATTAAPDNITYEHTLLKGLIGLDSNFISTIMVAQGEGGPSSSASLGTSGSESGDYWFTQATAGILSFYGVTNKVDSGTDLNTANFQTKFPMISYVRYVGETGFGAGSGGGGSVSLASADTNVSNMIAGTAQTMTTTSFEFDGEVYINHYLGVRPGYKLSFGNPGSSLAAIEGNTSSNGNLYFQTNGSYRMYINPSGNVGIGRTNPSYTLDVNGSLATNNALYHSNYQYYISDTNTRRYWDSNNIYWSCSPSWEMALYNGNLGIGETGPTSKLTLKGGGIEMKQSTHYMATRPSAPSNGSAVQDYEIASYGAGSYPNDMGFLRLRAGNNGNHTRIDLSAYTTSTSHDCHKTITFYTDANERMRINSQGKVGIGVAATTLYNNNYQLQVSSGCKAGYFNTGQSIAMGSGFKFSWGSQDSTGAAIEGHASNNYLKFWTGSSERMRLTDTGLGIGTPSPNAKLEISAGVNKSHIRIADGYYNDYNSYLYPALTYFARTDGVVRGDVDPYANGGASASISFTDRDGTPNNGTDRKTIRSSDIVFHTGYNNWTTIQPTERMRITAEGNVGIGNSSPEYLLDLADSTYANGGGYPPAEFIRFSTANASGNSSGGLIWKTNYGGSYTKISAKIEAICENDYFRQGLAFFTGNETYTTDATERMRIDMDGNVGIGTTSPQSLLHLAGVGDVVLRLQADTNDNGEGDNPMIEFRQDGNLLTGLIGTGNLPPGGVSDGNDNALYIQHMGSNGIVFLSGPSQNTPSTSLERMRITPSGNVGIGTTSPGYKLHIVNPTLNNNIQDLLCLETHTQATQIGPAMLFRQRWNNGSYWNLARISAVEQSGYGGQLIFYTNEGTGSADNTVTERMRINELGQVGIGTTAPNAKLEINGGYISTDPTNHVAQLLRLVQEYSGDFASAGHEGGVGMQFLVDNQNQNYWPIGEIYFYCSNNDNSETDGSLRFRVSNNNNTSGSATDRANVDAMTIHHTGRVGIGTTSPGFPLEISGDVTGPYIGQVGYMTSSGHPTTSGASSDPISLKTSNVIWSQGYIMASSDRRIKENIVDVSDNLALEMVRNIPVKYYEYKDKLIKGNEKTIGFIAQEVKEQLPIAVSIQKNMIPNEMRKLENISWEEIKDNSDNIINYKLTTDLSGCSGVKYRFYVSNDISGNDEINKEVIGNTDNSFIFKEKWNNVFCYGREVDDFHTLDKQKLFALNFSATQELDRKVIALETKNTELENEVATLKSELAAIKQHLGI